MSDSIDVTAELLSGFLDEAPEYLTMLDEGLLAFETKLVDGSFSIDDPDDYEQMNAIFRAAHSLKGLGAAMGFDKIRDLTHLMETLFDDIRMGKRGLNAPAFETLFGVFDKLRALVDELSVPPDEPVSIDDALKSLQQILDTPCAEAKASADTDAPEVPAGDGAPEVSKPVSQSEPKETVGEESKAMFDDPALAQLFIETSTETLDELNQGLLKLENLPDDVDLLNEIFRHAHNIKGASGAAGLDCSYRLTHDMETVLDRVRNKQLGVEGNLVNALFSAVDRLREDMDLVKEGCLNELMGKSAPDMFSEWLGQSREASGDADAQPESSAQIAESFGAETLTVTISFPKGFAEAEIQAYLIHNKLADIGTVISSDPDIDALDGTADVERMSFAVETNCDPGEIKKLIGAFSVESIDVSSSEEGAASPPDAQELEQASPAVPTAPIAEAPKPVESQPKKTASSEPAKKSSAAAKPAAKQPVAKASETIRVDLERLDQLLNLGGELVINKARFGQIRSQLEPVFSKSNLRYLVDEMADRLGRLDEQISSFEGLDGGARSIAELKDTVSHVTSGFATVRDVLSEVYQARTVMSSFAEALHGLDRVSEGLQRGIMETRMVAVGPLFQRFRRSVRDMAKATGKEVELVLHGEATELDKRMIDELADPLTHMVRNSVDHGLETPEERLECGKDRTGRVELNAYHRGRHICIEVRDDGHGVNIDAVREKIIERELATSAQVEQLSDKEVIQYVFKPGFSTAKQVTDLSGRGMGMDIVVNKIEMLNGTIEIDSTPGQGASVVIKLPLTLAIITALIARIGEGVYAVPLDTVSEIITVKPDSLQSIQGRCAIQVRDRVIPVARFEEVFDLADTGGAAAISSGKELTLVILCIQNDFIGLVVDEMIGQQEVVIKSIAENYRNVTGIAGASIMGDGRVSLILDVAAMMTMFTERESSARPPASASQATQQLCASSTAS